MDGCLPCKPGCEDVFDAVMVSYAVRGMARVMWSLLPTFTDPNPLTFQLEVGSTASNDSDDWEPVGLPVVDQYMAHDPDQRVWGNTNWTHYRVRLDSASGTHYSQPTGGLGVLAKRDWLKAREIIRQRVLAYRVAHAGQEGYLLKRRWTGQKCTRCLNYQTDEPEDPGCPRCYGTGFECGYYYPVSCVYAEMSPRTYRIELDPSRGAVNSVVIRAEMVMTEVLGEEDVWVNKATDDRYYVHRVTHTAEVRGVPLVAQVEMSLIPYSSAIYGIEIPEQLEHLLGGG
jgi:hypothetical protein